MGVRKFRSVAEMSGPAPLPPLEPDNLRLAVGLMDVALGLSRFSLRPGVRKFRSLEEADACRRARGTRQEALGRLGRDRGLLAVYLFGSRADDGLRLLSGEPVRSEGSDLDIGIVFPDPGIDLHALVKLDFAFGEVFAPLRVDLVPIQRVDPLFQVRIIDGHRIFAADSTAADLYELLVFRRAADLLPLQRARELELFGVNTS